MRERVFVGYVVKIIISWNGGKKVYCKLGSQRGEGKIEAEGRRNVAKVREGSK